MLQFLPEQQPQQQLSKLPQALYRLLDPQASVDLPSASLGNFRQLDNRELDKLFAALGRNKATWRRALVLHEWLLSMGHIPDDRLCTTLIRVCSQHGQAMTALSLYDWMRSSQREGGAALVPTVYTYTAAMRAALTGNMIERAVKVRFHDGVSVQVLAVILIFNCTSYYLHLFRLCALLCISLHYRCIYKPVAPHSRFALLHHQHVNMCKDAVLGDMLVTGSSCL